jgi:molybdopterin/thiamine biosynthesis adenylyltransferase
MIMDNISEGCQPKDAFFQTAFQRNIGLLTVEEQNKLRQSKIAIVGVGGVGGFHLQNLVRLGVGKFTISDLETFETPNIQRQCGAFINTLGQNKAEAMEKMCRGINPHIEIQSFPRGINAQNIEQFLEGADVFLDGIDFFAIEERRLAFKKAREKGIYAITAGPLGFGCALLIFSPSGMSFDEYFDLNDSMSYLEKIVAFGVGLAPKCLQLQYLSLDCVDITGKQGPSLVSSCVLCSAIATTETIKIILKRKRPRCAPHYFQFDPYLQAAKKGYLLGGNRNPLQQLKRWYLVKKCSVKPDASKAR